MTQAESPNPGDNPEKPRKSSRRTRFKREEIEEIVRRVQAGETRKAVADDYGVTREAISQIIIRETTPEQERRPSLRRIKFMTDAEKAAFKTALDTTKPRDHDFHLIGHQNPDSWTINRARALAKKICGKSPAMRVMREFLTREHEYPVYDPDEPPRPPEPHDIRRLSPELAADEEFVSYYLSDAAWQLTLREYEYHKREWERMQLERQAAALRRAQREAAKEPPPPPPPPAPAMPAPGLRVGKHRASKGSPFTKPKRKKRR